MSCHVLGTSAAHDVEHIVTLAAELVAAHDAWADHSDNRRHEAAALAQEPVLDALDALRRALT